MKTYLLLNGTYIDDVSFSFIQKPLLIDGFNQRLHFITEDEAERYKYTDNVEVLDCRGKYIMKSFGIAHHHIYSALATGMPSPSKNPQNFHQILEQIWWKLDRCLNRELIEISAKISALQIIRSGSTFVIDHHSSPNFIRGSLDIIANVLENAGLSHILCYEITDRNGEKATEEALEETYDYLTKQRGLVGLHASFSLTDKTLVRSKELCEKFDTGIHIHVAEDKYDQVHCKENFGISVVERLKRFGLLQSPKSILVHALHLDAVERETIAECPCWVVQNTESNLNNRVGYFDGAGLGTRIMLGTDGMHSNMIQSAKYAYFANRESTPPTLDTIYRRLRNVHRYAETNDFLVDNPTDIVVFQYYAPTSFNESNFLGHFFFGFQNIVFTHVISKGNIILKDYKITKLNEDDILDNAKELSKYLWKKYKEI